MSWIAALWRWRRASASNEMRPEQQHLDGVEQLEPRLCLGSMHASATADWGAPSAGLVPSQVELSNFSENEHTQIPRSAETADGTTDQASDEQATHTEESGAKPAKPASPENPSQTNIPSLNAGLANQLLNGQTDTDSTSPPSVVADSDFASPSSNLEKSGGSNAGSSTETDSNAQPESQAGDPATESNDSDSGAVGVAANAWDAQSLDALGLTLDEHGNAVGFADHSAAANANYKAWWANEDQPVVIKYDFRSHGGEANLITTEQKARTVESLNKWSEATGGKIVFEQDTTAPATSIINIGVGSLEPFGYVSASNGVLGLSGGQVTIDSNQEIIASGVAWLDKAENWDTIVGNGDPEGTYDFSTVVSHEIGHALGYADSKAGTGDIMDGRYTAERALSTIESTVAQERFYRTLESNAHAAEAFEMHALTAAESQLSAGEVEQLLQRASAASASQDAIIAVVDRNGRVLGVRVESQALAQIPDTDTLVFAIDGAISKARTAAFFSNGAGGNDQAVAPITSRTVRFVSQSTVTEREVNSNPNVDNASAATAAASTTRGPGFVAPIGVGGHFPPEIPFTPLVDLFAIEHTNRDSNTHPGADGIRGTADDFELRTTGAGPDTLGRFNIDPNFVPAGKGLYAPESYGDQQNSGLMVDAQSRGIATLPGGIPLFRDSDDTGLGDILVGGIGVFFPGTEGYASFEQGFVSGVGQREIQRTNAPRVLEAEYIAYAAAGGSLGAQLSGVQGAKIGTINGVAAVPDLDLPFGRLDLVGVTLQVYGPCAGTEGLKQLLALGEDFQVGGTVNGTDQALIGGVGGLYRDGELAPDGWLVTAHDSTVDDLTAADVEQMIQQGITAAMETRAAIRLPLGSRTKMVFAVTDTSGEILGLYRMPDATIFSIDVAVAKARNVAYYSDANQLQPEDQVKPPGTAFTNRTFRFLSQPRYPSGIDGTQPPPFSILNDDNINNLTAENQGAPAAVGDFNSVLGHDAFFPMTNFRDPGDPNVVAAGNVPQPLANQNGIVFFPGSTPIYKNGALIGGFGVSGDGVDQDDVVTYLGSLGFRADGNAVRADATWVDGVRLPYQKFLRNPFG